MTVLRDLNGTRRRVCVGCVFLLGLASLVALAPLTGCRPESSRSQRQPPVIIVVRNSSGLDLQTVSLRSLVLADSQADWLGTIAPVPRESTQVFGRRSAAFPWPRVVEVVWTDERQREYSQKIALELLLKQMGPADRKTLIVEIRSEGKLRVYPKAP